MSAIRVARAFTGRDLIVKFAGCYRGHADHLLVAAGSELATFGRPSSAGVPESFTALDRKSTRLNSSHGYISYAVFCLKKKTKPRTISPTASRPLFASSSEASSAYSLNSKMTRMTTTPPARQAVRTYLRLITAHIDLRR